MQPLISVKEARKLLGKSSQSMTDEEIENTVSTLTVIAREALQQAHQKRQMKKDAESLANLAYDIYRDKS